MRRAEGNPAEGGKAPLAGVQPETLPGEGVAPPAAGRAGRRQAAGEGGAAGPQAAGRAEGAGAAPAPPVRQRKTPARGVGKETEEEKEAGEGRIFRQAFCALLLQPVEGAATEKLAASFGGQPPATAAQAIAMAQILKAIGGDTPAFNAVRDIIGEKKPEKAAQGDGAPPLEQLLARLCGEKEL